MGEVMHVELRLPCPPDEATDDEALGFQSRQDALHGEEPRPQQGSQFAGWLSPSRAAA
jgi:hypothetical protein